MLPAPALAPLAPLDPHKTRALTTIYAPRKFKPRKNKTAQARMLDELPIKNNLSPFHPLPAIGQKTEEKTKTKVYVFDLNKTDRPGGIKLQDILKPLTPLRLHTYRKNTPDTEDGKPQPQQLVREHTYDVIEPIYVNAAKVKKRDRSISRRPPESVASAVSEDKNEAKVSPKTRFKNAAREVAKLSSMPETGKLLCLRERQTFKVHCDDEDSCRLQRLPQSPTQKLNKLSEIFQCLDTRGRHRDKMKKENSWF